MITVPKKINYIETFISIVFIRLCNFLVLILLFINVSDAKTLRYQDSIPSKLFREMQLKKVLDITSANYDVMFVYESMVVDNKIVHEFKIHGNLENDLKILLPQFDLDYSKIKDRFYVIYQKRPEKLNDKKSAISGNVIDAITGLPLIGADVYFSNSLVGTTTSIDGYFKIETFKKTEDITISYLGYESEYVSLKSKTANVIKLYPTVKDLDEVVHIGYGIIKKSDVTGSLSAIKAQNIQRVSTTTIENALQGQAPGVFISNQSGSPGNPFTIRIRGNSTINFPDPLFVIDGVPLRDGSIKSDNPTSIDFLNPEDIEKIEILKDASASAIYGARAANGVVLIETKSGINNKHDIFFKYTFGTQQIRKKLDLMNGTQYLNFYNSMQKLMGREEKIVTDLTNIYNTDWQDEIFQTGIQNNVQFSAAGSEKKYSYYLNLNYSLTDGIVRSSSFERYSFRLNTETKLTTRLTFKEKLSFTNSNRLRVIEGNENPEEWGDPLVGAIMADPTSSPYDENGRWNSLARTPNVWNPAGKLDRDKINYKNNRLVGNLEFNYTIFNALKFKSLLGTDFLWGKFNIQKPSFYISEREKISPPFYQIEDEKFQTWIWENYLTFEKKILNHHIAFLSGLSSEENIISNIQIRGGLISNSPTMSNVSGLDIEKLISLNGADNAWALKSFLARANYDYNERFYLTINIRRDGSSRFKDNYRFGWFPSYAMAYNFTKETSNALPFLNFGKVRYGWGIIGNQNIGSNYAYISGMYYDPINLKYPFGKDESTQLGAHPDGVANPTIHWEKVIQHNLGIDLYMFNYHLNISSDIFNKKTIGMLIAVPVPDVLGVEGSPITNAGSILNQGWENSLTIKGGDHSKVKYNVSFNLTYVKNLVTDLSSSNPIWSNFGASRTFNGHPIAAFYGYKVEGIFNTLDEVLKWAFQDSKTMPGDLKFKDIDGDNVITENDKTYLGDPFPRWYLGSTLSVKYKNMELSCAFFGVYGNKIYNYMKNYYTGFGATNKSPEMLNYWTPDNINTNIPRATPGGKLKDFNANNRFSNIYLEDGSYLRLKDITFSYNLKPLLLEKLKAKNIELFISLQNIFVLTHYSGYDPDISTKVSWVPNALNIGMDQAQYPQPRTYLFGINLNF